MNYISILSRLYPVPPN